MPRVSSSRIPVSISRSNSVLSDISNSHAAAAARRNSSSEAGKENDKGKGRNMRTVIMGYCEL